MKGDYLELNQLPYNSYSSNHSSPTTHSSSNEDDDASSFDERLLLHGDPLLSIVTKMRSSYKVVEGQLLEGECI